MNLPWRFLSPNFRKNTHLDLGVLKSRGGYELETPLKFHTNPSNSTLAWSGIFHTYDQIWSALTLGWYEKELAFEIEIPPNPMKFHSNPTQIPPNRLLPQFEGGGGNWIQTSTWKLSFFVRFCSRTFDPSNLMWPAHFCKQPNSFHCYLGRTRSRERRGKRNVEFFRNKCMQAFYTSG